MNIPQKHIWLLGYVLYIQKGLIINVTLIGLSLHAHLWDSVYLKRCLFLKSLLIIPTLIIFSIHHLFAQDDSTFKGISNTGYYNEPYYVFKTAEVKPEFPGGYTGFIKFLYEHINFSSKMADTLGHVRIYCLFMVTKTGKITDIIVSGENETLTSQIHHALGILPPL